jgi:hypothetical protein
MLLRYSPLLLTASVLSAVGVAPACVQNTLANYEALPATGCDVGAILNFSGFSFSQSGTVTVGAANITVTPVFDIIGIDYGLSFTSSGFTVSGTDSSTYVITYLEDPSGPIHSLDAVLDDPVVAPGLAQLTTIGCLGAAFTGATCPTSNTVSVSAFDDGISPQLTASVSFPGQSTVGVQNTILLEGNSTGSAGITGVAVASQLPEPGTGWLTAAAVLAVLVLTRKPSLKIL